MLFLELRSSEILKPFQNPAILLFRYFQKTHGTSKPSDYIYFMKKTNAWIVCDIRRPFGD